MGGWGCKVGYEGGELWWLANWRDLGPRWDDVPWRGRRRGKLGSHT